MHINTLGISPYIITQVYYDKDLKNKIKNMNTSQIVKLMSIRNKLPVSKFKDSYNEIKKERRYNNQSKREDN